MLRVAKSEREGCDPVNQGSRSTDEIRVNQVAHAPLGLHSCRKGRVAGGAHVVWRES